MAGTAHRIEVWHLRSGSWYGTCTCGWLTPNAEARDDVVAAAHGHAPAAEVVDAPERDAPVARPGRRHERLRAEMERTPDGTMRFRSRCSCGWTSAPVDMSLVVRVWDQHRDGPTTGG